MDLRRAAHPFLDFLLPTDCFLCGTPVDPRQRSGACSGCWSGFRPIRAPYCRRCGHPGAESTDLAGPRFCPSCVGSRVVGAEEVRAAVVYDRRARSVLLRAKFGGRSELLPVVADQVAAAIRAARFVECTEWIVPAPSHFWNDLRRGFSPGRELGRRVGRALDIPCCTRALGRRPFPWVGMKRLDSTARQRAIRDAVFCRRSFAGDRILLIDDVMTTGATGAACVAALRRAGAAEVRVAVWARAVR